MIAEYEQEGRNELLSSPRQYALSQSHKHLKEMSKICGLSYLPVFSPIVGDFYSGMEVSVGLHKSQINGSLEDIKRTYANTYKGNIVKFKDNADEGGFLASNAFSMLDSMEISVFGNEERILLVSRFDNLGKGASGAAIQNMNILLGVAEETGLNV